MIHKTSRVNFFWPYIHNETSAREAAKQGWSAALFISGATIFMAIIGKTPLSSLYGVIIICLIGFGCLKMSRSAAIFGLALTLLEGVYKYSAHSTFGVMPIFAIFYVNSIRGTFNYHKIKKENSGGAL